MAFGIPKGQRQPTREETVLAPAPGCYSGTVDGHPAIFAVTEESVTAWWLAELNGGWPVPQNNAWTIERRRFLPSHGNSVWDLVAVKIRASSRKVADAAA